MLKALFASIKSSDANSHHRELKNKSFFNLVLRIFGRGLNYLLILLIIRIFGNDDFGKWVLVSTLFLIAQLITSLGLRIASLRYFAEFSSKEINLLAFYRKTALILFLSSIIGIAILHFSAEYFNSLYQKDYIAEYLRIISWAILPLNFIDLHAGVFRGMRKIGVFSFFDSFSKPLFFILFLLIGLLYQVEFVEIFYYYNYAIFSIALLSCILIYRSFSLQRADLSQGTNTSTREILSVSLPMLLTSSLDMLNRWADIIILGFYSSDFLIGAYGLAVRLSGIIPISLQSVNSISAAKFRELYVANNLSELKQVVIKSSKIIFWLGLIPALVLIFGGSFILSFFDPLFKIAFWSLFFLSISQLVNIFAGSTFPLLNMTGSHTKLMNIAMFTAALNLILNFWLIPIYGIVGAAAATATSTIVNNLICIVVIKKKLGFSPVYLPFRS